MRQISFIRNGFLITISMANVLFSTSVFAGNSAYFHSGYLGGVGNEYEIRYGESKYYSGYSDAGRVALSGYERCQRYHPLVRYRCPYKPGHYNSDYGYLSEDKLEMRNKSAH